MSAECCFVDVGRMHEHLMISGA
uniref:Uncharacterized protein n=1 Tax=Arundo donax TaxID=35708 RepID=A0A0A8YLT9_ARUDO